MPFSNCSGPEFQNAFWFLATSATWPAFQKVSNTIAITNTINIEYQDQQTEDSNQNDLHTTYPWISPY